MPIATTEPGVEEVSSRVDQGPAPRPWVPPRAEVDGASRADFFIAALAATGIAAHLALRYGFHAPSLAQFSLYLTLILGGLPLVVRLIRKVFVREFGSDLLAGISIVVSILMGQYLVDSNRGRHCAGDH